MNHTHEPEGITVPDMTLEDGFYTAFCKEKTLILASANGHGAIFPQAQCEVRNGEAQFFRDGALLWSCPVSYAASHFHIERL